MGHRLPFLLLFFLAVSNVSPSAATAAPRGLQKLGGWTPIGDIKDPHVQDLGKWAVVMEDIATGSHLVFQEVVGGETQVVAGTKYRLHLLTADGGSLNAGTAYVAVVWEETTGARRLLSFNPGS